MHWILVSIDGTGSRDWRPENGGYSHCHQFYTDFGRHGMAEGWTINKTYLEGPDDQITGADSGDIKRNGQRFIARVIERLFPRDVEHLPSMGTDMRRTRRLVSRRERIASHEHLRIVLVGHSRGGAIVIDMARELRQLAQVYFMGLFDAVDRSAWIDGGRVENTRYVYHALRGLEDSRSSFGNTGTEGLSRSQLRTFQTSHGGIGGAPSLNPSGVTSDYSCSVETLTSSIERTLGHDRGAVCRDESRAAYDWVVGRARRHNVPV